MFGEGALVARRRAVVRCPDRNATVETVVETIKVPQARAVTGVCIDFDLAVRVVRDDEPIARRAQVTKLGLSVLLPWRKNEGATDKRARRVAAAVHEKFGAVAIARSERRARYSQQVTLVVNVESPRVFILESRRRLPLSLAVRVVDEIGLGARPWPTIGPAVPIFRHRNAENFEDAGICQRTRAAFGEGAHGDAPGIADKPTVMIRDGNLLMRRVDRRGVDGLLVGKSLDVPEL